MPAARLAARATASTLARSANGTPMWFVPGFTSANTQAGRYLRGVRRVLAEQRDVGGRKLLCRCRGRGQRRPAQRTGDQRLGSLDAPLLQHRRQTARLAHGRTLECLHTGAHHFGIDARRLRCLEVGPPTPRGTVRTGEHRVEVAAHVTSNTARAGVMTFPARPAGSA